ncbi:MAG: hypothetical protein ACLUGW_10530, partial [Oscillospiraceae bacterium]
MVHEVETGISVDLHVAFTGVGGVNVSSGGAHTFVVNDLSLYAAEFKYVPAKSTLVGVTIPEEVIVAVDIIAKGFAVNDTTDGSEGIKGIEHSLLALKGDV